MPLGRTTGRRPKLVRAWWGICWLLIAGSLSHAGDWPQILGPQRNGMAVDEKLIDSIPATGLPKIWEARVGSGAAGVVVRGDIAVLFHRLRDQDTLSAYDAATGKPLWSRGFKTDFQPQVGGEDGPLAAPTIHADRVYALAANGGLYCVELNTGEVVWERKTQQEFHAPAGYFGAGSSPLVEGNKLIVNVGGDRDTAGVVAFDLKDGSTLWKAVRDQASYSSPIAATIGGTRHLLCITRLNLVSLDPEQGTERFRTPFGQRGPTVNAAVPVLIKNQILLTASYGIGAELIDVRGDEAQVAWNDDVLSSQYTTPILHEGTVYGIDGRQDLGDVTLKCFDPQTRKVFWSKSGLVYATLLAADGKLLVMQTDGELKMVELSKKAYRELGSTNLLPGIARALPALSKGRLYVRNANTLRCYSLAKE